MHFVGHVDNPNNYTTGQANLWFRFRSKPNQKANELVGTAPS